jgi:hypothetical protein
MWTLPLRFFARLLVGILRPPSNNGARAAYRLQWLGIEAKTCKRANNERAVDELVLQARMVPGACLCADNLAVAVDCLPKVRSPVKRFTGLT